MTMQLKNVSLNAAAHNVAHKLHGLADLSREAAVILFRTLVLNERVSPSTETGKELVRADIVNTFGQLKPWVAHMTEEVIEELVWSAGQNLAPMSEPHSMADLGHKAVKGASKVGKRAQDAQRSMEKTAFCYDRRVLALATQREHSLTREERMALYVARMESHPDTVYFPVSYDYRGRMYYRGGIITPQGSDLLKGMLRFADAAPIGKHGRYAIELALADSLGIKTPKREAISTIRKMALAPLWTELTHGYQAAALAMELQDLLLWIGSGNPEESFESGIICHQDATCSGLQIAAAITGCRETAIATNCVASSKDEAREDVYGEVADLCAEGYSQGAEYARKYGRDMYKYALMIMGYGAGIKTIMRQCTDYLLTEHNIDWEFDEQSKMELEAALHAKCGATMALLSALQELVEAHGDDDLTWNVNGTKVVQHKTEGVEHSAGSFKMEFDATYDQQLNKLALAPNFVHSLDASQMQFAVSFLNGKPVAAIHDSLGTRPCDYWEAGVQVRKAFAACKPRETAAEFFKAYGMSVPYLGDYTPQEAMNSAYFWC